MRCSRTESNPGRRLQGSRKAWSEEARGAGQGRLVRRCVPIPVVQLSDELKLRKGEAAFTQTITEVLLEITLWKGRPCSVSPKFPA